MTIAILNFTPESLLGLAVAFIVAFAGMVILYRADGDGDIPDKIEPDTNGQCPRCGRPVPNDDSAARVATQITNK